MEQETNWVATMNTVATTIHRNAVNKGFWDKQRILGQRKK